MSKETRNILIVTAVILAIVYRKKIKSFLKKKTSNGGSPSNNGSSETEPQTPAQELEKQGYIDSIKSSKREYFDRVSDLDNIKMDDIYSVLDNLSTQELKDLYGLNISEFEKEFGYLLLDQYSITG
jgi:hypothetical protein